MANSLISESVANPYQEIEPLQDFDWKEVGQVKLRPFKERFHLTMGLQHCTLSDLVLMDKTYLERIKLRRALIADKTDEVIGYQPVARDAVRELYCWLFEVYLPKRFPTMFLRETSNDGKRIASGMTTNLVTNEPIHLEPPEPEECLETIGRHVDCEFAILLPTANTHAKPFCALPTTEPKEVYHLHAFVLTFPSGFSTRQKLGLPLAGMIPIESLKVADVYKAYMALFRAFGKIMQRANWSISTDGILFKPQGLHIDIRSNEDIPEGRKTEMPAKGHIEMAPSTYTPSEEELAKWAKASKEINPDKCSLRMERQTLHRLERSGAIIFGFKTILEPLSELKREGSGEALAAALKSFRVGTVPAMDVYKHGVIWREPLVKYLTG